MSRLSDRVSDYCSSEQFIFLESSLKEHAESLLSFWCNAVGEDMSITAVQKAVSGAARLDIPVAVKKSLPQLLKQFLSYTITTGMHSGAQKALEYVASLEKKYAESFRDNGTVRGETFVKKYTDVNRNDPCPCGSGKKFKKCCMSLIS